MEHSVGNQQKTDHHTRKGPPGGMHPTIRSPKGALSSDLGKGMTFSQIREALSKAARKRKPDHKKVR
jgi:hypothetical protein